MQLVQALRNTVITRCILIFYKPVTLLLFSVLLAASGTVTLGAQHLGANMQPSSRDPERAMFKVGRADRLFNQWPSNTEAS